MLKLRADYRLYKVFDGKNTEDLSVSKLFYHTIMSFFNRGNIIQKGIGQE